MKRIITTLSLLSTIGLSVTTAAEELKNEFFMFSGTNLTGENVRYENRFYPYYYGDKGEGLQTVKFEDESVPAFGVGFTHHFSDKWSLQVTTQYQRRKLTSDSNTVSVIYDYEQWVPTPPGPIIHKDLTINSPQNPSARYSDFGASINAVYCIDMSKLQLEVIGGLVFHRISQGRMQNLYFQNGVMVSHGSIFTSSALYETRWEDTYQVGANLGLRVAVPVSERTSLFAEARYAYFRETSIEQELAAIEEIQYFWQADSMETIEPLLILNDIELNPSTLTISAGASIAF